MFGWILGKYGLMIPNQFLKFPYELFKVVRTFFPGAIPGFWMGKIG